MYKNKKPRNNNFFFRFSCSLVFWKLFVFLVFASKVQAGGYDKPTSIPPSLAPPNEQLPVPTLLDWENWEKPYWVDNNICRENKGDLICLSPKLARQLRWEIPSRNESMNLN